MALWNHVTIIGVGLIGGSLGLALKRRGLAERVVGVGRRESSLTAAREAGTVDETTLDVADGVRGSELVVLATPVGRFEDIARIAAPALEHGAVVIDVGSTKAHVVSRLEAVMPEGRTFLGCHPVAGSERRGPEAAREDLFEGELCIVTPTDRTPGDVLDRVRDTWEAVGMRVRTTDPLTHDRLLAEVSHLPHVAASALVRVLSDEAETTVGPGWTDTTRVASGDADLWRDILMTNAAPVSLALERLEAALDTFRDALDRGNADRVRDLLAEAKHRRDRLTARKDDA